MNRPRKQHRYQARELNGVLVLDKPIHMSSNQALQQVRHLFQAKKAGHGGTLDPLATGVLIICFGRATRLLRFLLEGNKSYQVIAAFGVTTTTGDVCGDVLETRPVNVSIDQVRQELSRLEGDISQVPPMYSALKHQGQPLHVLARQGIEVPRQARTVTIFANQFESYDVTHHQLAFTTTCSKGTYVRTLVEDLGCALGCGAHVTGLRRVSSGPFDEQDMVQLDTLMALKGDLDALDRMLLPAACLVSDLPAVVMSDAQLKALLQGQSPALPELPASADWVRLLNTRDQLVGVGRCYVGDRPLSSIVWLDFDSVA